MADLHIIYTTLADIDSAKSIARRLVEAGLAACTNLLPGMHSCYRWKGELCEDDEVVLLIKTDVQQLAACQAKLKEWHPYELPCIFVLRPDAVDPDYAAWLTEQLHS